MYCLQEGINDTPSLKANVSVAGVRQSQTPPLFDTSVIDTDALSYSISNVAM